MPDDRLLQAITEINLDVSLPNVTIVHAKQYDTARKVKAHLFDSGVRWTVPSTSYVAVVSFKKADRIGGFYDESEDGQSAIAVDADDDSVIYILLDRNLTTTAGNVNVEITFYEEISAARLSTFSFIVQVEAASITELDLASNPYFSILASQIHDVLAAKDAMTGLSASANRLAPGADPTAVVTGGTSSSDPFDIVFGIPTFAGITASTSKLAPGATPTATVTGGTSGTSKYNIAFGIPTFAGLTVSASSLTPGTPPTAIVSGGTSGTTKYNIAFGIPQGAKGDTPSPVSTAYAYANSTSGTTVPSSGWGANPSPTKGRYLWSRATTTWDNNTTTVSYAVSYIGTDGTGAVNSVNGETGDVVLDASDIKKTDGTTTIQADLTTLHTNKAELIRVSNISVPVAKWAQMISSDPDYASVASHFAYKGTLDSSVNSAFANVTSNMYAQVVFNVEDAMSGNYGPITKCDAGKVYVYAASMPTAAVALPSVVVIKMEGD